MKIDHSTANINSRLMGSYGDRQDWQAGSDNEVSGGETQQIIRPLATIPTVICKLEGT